MCGFFPSVSFRGYFLPHIFAAPGSKKKYVLILKHYVKNTLHLYKPDRISIANIRGKALGKSFSKYFY